MDSTIGLLDAAQARDLNFVRAQLVRLEDSITFYLIERAQFPRNAKMYEPGGVKIPGSNLSLFDYILRDTERVHSRVRRYQSPDEYPFFPDAIEQPILRPLKYPDVLHPNDINLNAKLKKSYLEDILPAICHSGSEEEDASNFGSAAVQDVLCLQALSRRIHYGKWVAEAKFSEDPSAYVELIKRNDTKAINEKLTNAAVEAKVLERLGLKARTYGVDPDANAKDHQPKVDEDTVVAMYKEYVIPLTKEVEVEYFQQRLKGTEWE